jgi:hypothetical protein
VAQQLAGHGMVPLEIRNVWELVQPGVLVSQFLLLVAQPAPLAAPRNSGVPQAVGPDSRRHCARNGGLTRGESFVEIEGYRPSECRSKFHDKLDQRLVSAFEMRAIFANRCYDGLC